MTDTLTLPTGGAASLLHRLLAGFRAQFVFSAERDHWKRYVLGAFVSVIGVWVLALAYLLLTPPSYASKWTLILPGSGSGVSVSLESIGQTSSLSASPFSSPSLSPKVIYKEIAISEQVLAAAAKSIGMKPSEFGAPQIKLIDETALMLFEIKARKPELARQKAMALIDAFDQQLDLLRHDEIDRRAVSVRDTLKGYQANLHAARQNILDKEEETGLVSVEQFNQLATSLEETQRKLSDARAEAARADAAQTTLIERLGIDARLAALALVLAADPVFTKALGEYAEAGTAVASQSALLGRRNPLLVRDTSRRDAALATLRRSAKRCGLDVDNDLPRLMIVLNSKSREELLKSLITGESESIGKHQQVASLEHEIELMDQRVKNMTITAARLEDLKKDHIVAEAVFSSALARLDTNKADLYASYPIVQVLSPPDLPDTRTQPRPIFAILGGVVGSLLAAAAWTLAWLRQLFVRKHTKNA